jgi:hypothetical protein
VTGVIHGGRSLAPYEKSRFVGFVDVLGYKDIVLNKKYNDSQRYHYLHSVFMALAQSAIDVIKDLNKTATIQSVQFSDSFYFSSTSAVEIVSTISEFFANVFTIFDHTIESDDEWLPFLRGGIVYDWMFEGLDSTLPPLQNPTQAFRNPIGPAVAKAYILSEESGIEGMRLVTTKEVRDRFEAELPTIDQGSVLGNWCSQLHPVFLKMHTDYGKIFEIPWFESRLRTNNMVGTFDVLRSAERQFNDLSMKHYRGTWDTILSTPGIQNSEQLSSIAAEIRWNTVQKMALANWRRRKKPIGDDWHDWLAAEGIIETYWPKP